MTNRRGAAPLRSLRTDSGVKPYAQSATPDTNVAFIRQKMIKSKEKHRSPPPKLAAIATMYGIRRGVSNFHVLVLHLAYSTSLWRQKIDRTHKVCDDPDPSQLYF